MRLPAFVVFCAIALPCLGQQGSIVSNGRIYLYNNESERQIVEALVRQRQDLDREISSLKSKDYDWREPTPQEVAALEENWKAKNPFKTSHSMPNFSKQRIPVDKAETLNQKLAETEMRLRLLEQAEANKSKTPTPTRNTPAPPTAAQQAKQVAAYNAAFSASFAKAIGLYDFAGQPKSEGGQRMSEIDDTLRAYGDPLFSDPNKPLIIAQMVAKELRIAPKPKKAPNAKK